MRIPRLPFASLSLFFPCRRPVHRLPLRYQFSNQIILYVIKDHFIIIPIRRSQFGGAREFSECETISDTLRVPIPWKNVENLGFSGFSFISEQSGSLHGILLQLGEFKQNSLFNYFSLTLQTIRKISKCVFKIYYKDSYISISVYVLFNILTIKCNAYFLL